MKRLVPIILLLSLGVWAQTPDADYAARCAVAQANNGRCQSLDTQLPANASAPVSGQFPDAYQNTAGFTSNGSQAVDTTTKKSGSGAGKIVTMFDAGGSTGLGPGQTTWSNAGTFLVNFSGNGSIIATRAKNYDGTPNSGIHDFYLQWRQRMDSNRLAYNADNMPNSARGIKQLILTLNPKVIDANNWWYPTSCSSAEIVVVEGGAGAAGFNHIPMVYMSCNGYTGLNLGAGDANNTVIQNGTGCTMAGAGRGTSAPTVTSIARSSGVVTFVTSVSLGAVTLGTTRIYLGSLPMPNVTSGTATSLNGVYVIQSATGTTYTVTRLYETVAPEDVTSFAPATGYARALSAACWMYKPNNWMHFQLHVKMGQDRRGVAPLPKDSVVELWGGYDGEPSQLLVSIPAAHITDSGILTALSRISDDGDSANNRLNGTAYSDTRAAGTNDGAWFLNVPGGPFASGFGQAQLMHYETDRCPANLPTGITVSTLTRSGTNPYTVEIDLSSSLSDGSGGTMCLQTGRTIVLTGTTLDGGSFNQTYTLIAPTDGRHLYATRSTLDGGSVATGAPGGTPVLTVPEYKVNCNGSTCTTTDWMDEVIFASQRIPDPGHTEGTNLYPDPPDHLQVTGSQGATSLTWTCNDPTATYKIKRYTGTLLAAESAQSYTQIGTKAACATRYGTQSYTDSTASVGTSYVYVVTATNATGDSTRSNPAVATVTVNPYPGLPTGAGWHSLGTQTKLNASVIPSSAIAGTATAAGDTTSAVASGICPKNQFGGSHSNFRNTCRRVYFQSGMFLDTYRNLAYLGIGGGHDDYYGNEMYQFDLTANPVTLKRITDPDVPTAMDSGSTAGDGLGGDMAARVAGNCVAALPVNQTATTDDVATLRRINGTDVTVTLSGAGLDGLVNPSTDPDKVGKLWVTIENTGNVNFPNGTYKIKPGTVPTPTAFTLAWAGTNDTAAAGLASTYWSSCVPNSGTGLGCRPNGSHSTGELQFISDGSNHANDVFFKVSGSMSCNAGDTDAMTWTVPAATVAARAWKSMSYVTGYSATSGVPGGFEHYAATDPDTHLVYMIDLDSNLSAYDYFGTQGTANKWYRMSSSGFSTTRQTAAIWKNATNTQKLLLSVGGCQAYPITSITEGTSGNFTVNTSYSVLNVASGANLWFYGAANSAFNSAATYTANATGATGSTLTFTAAGLAGNTSGAGGWVRTCAMNGSNNGGVKVADITTNATGAVTPTSWTTNTLASSNVDLGNSALGNTCAEFLSGGAAPVNNALALHGRAPGVTYYPTDAALVGWPNEGTSVYELYPDTTNQKLKCKRLDFTATGDDAPTGTLENYGTYNRFQYMPGPDAFLLLANYDQPARVLRLGDTTPVTLYTLTAVASPTAGGTISLSPGGGNYASGTAVTLTQTPNAGYTFTNWSGGCTGSGSCSVTMVAPTSVTANYSVAAVTLSSISVSPSSASIIAGSSQQFAATCTWSDASQTTCTNTVNWTSSSAAVLIGNAPAGLASGVSAGSATITATQSGKTGTASLTITAAPVVTGTPWSGSVTMTGSAVIR